MRLLALLLISISLYADILRSTKYDKDMQNAVKIYWLDYPNWKMYKAQLFQESRLNPYAKSSAGAKGLAQFMPSTWIQMQKKMNIPPWASPYMPSYAINAGAYYMRILRDGWSYKREIRQKHYLALASYNAGFGNILKAQRVCKQMGLKSVFWEDIKICLPKVTGKHSKETLIYVDRIYKWFLMLEGR